MVDDWEWDCELIGSLVLPSPRMSASGHLQECRCQLCQVRQEDNESLIDSLVLPSPRLSASGHLQECRCQLCNIKEEEEEMEDHLINALDLSSPQLSASGHSQGCRCQLCHIKHEDGESALGSGSENSWVTASEDGSNPAEKANCRILGVLKCYVYNLQQGDLITGSKVDEGVEAALKRWVGCGKPGVPCNLEHTDGITPEMVKNSWDMSDEERVVLEIDAYGKGLREMKCEIPNDVLDTANEILEWARKNGTVNRKDMGVTSSSAPLKITEC